MAPSAISFKPGKYPDPKEADAAYISSLKQSYLDAVERYAIPTNRIKYYAVLTIVLDVRKPGSTSSRFMGLMVSALCYTWNSVVDTLFGLGYMFHGQY